MVTTEGYIPALDTEEPTFEEVRTLLDENIQYFRTYHGYCDKVDSYYFGSNPVPTADGMEQIHTPIVMATINVATDHVDVNNLAITVPLASQRAKARAERIQKFYHGVWLNVKTPVKRAAVKHAFSYGIGWLKTTWDSDRWPNSPHLDDFDDDETYKAALEDFMERKNITFPFVVENISPRRLVWDTSRIGPRWVIEHYQMNPRDLNHMYPQWQRSTTAASLVEWTEYWDDTYFVFIAGNEIVDSGKHGYGFMPYAPILPANSLDWDDRPPHERYLGLVHGSLFDLADEHARAVTAYAAILRTVAWRTIDFVGPDFATELARKDYELWGGKNKVPAGVEVKASPYIQVPPDLLQHLSTIETLWEQATFPNVIRGLRPSGISSGFGVSVLAGMGRLVFQGVADGMARAIEQCNTHFAKMIENKAMGKVTVHARAEVHSFDQAIGPDDIRGYYENVVTLKAEAPEEREREAILARNLYGAGIISLYEAQKRAGVTNPLEMQVDILAERLQFQDPNVLAALGQLVAERVGLLQQAAEMLDTPQANTGEFAPGLGQLPRPGEASIQRDRQQQRAFPQGFPGMDALGSLLGAAPGGTTAQPNGARV